LAAPLAIQADGKIVAAGRAGTDFLVARYNGDGSLDASFGSSGIVTTDFGGIMFDAAFGVALQANGKIIAAGSTFNSIPSSADFALARYNHDGSLDSIFASGGKVTTDFGVFDVANGVALQSDGKIVAAGTGGSGSDFALARYLGDAVGADLSITKSGAPNPVLSGNRLTYTLALTNDGPQDATGVTVTDALPGSLHFNSVSSRQGTCTRSTATNPQPKGGTVTCSVGNLVHGANATITIVVTATTPGTVTNTAKVSGNETDPDSSNNSATATTAVVGT
jgi:uncharacterized delta-60 repeat protein/uncharacterized repeat protein (TIGR01451 family)